MRTQAQPHTTATKTTLAAFTAMAPPIRPIQGVR